METPDTVFISETLAAMAFYYGLLGGFVALALSSVARFLYRRVRSAFEWR